MPDGKPIVKEIGGIVERAQKDPHFRQELERDPVQAAHAAGFRLTWAEVRESLGLHGVSDDQMHEAMRAAISGSCTTTIKF